MSVKSFNALPCEPLRPPGIPNHWHFDLRYVPIDPTPSHLLFLIQLDSSHVHTERLPLGISTCASGMAFFPETGAEAAPEIAKALIHSFLHSFGLKQFERNPPPPFAPWKLTTEDPQLAIAVGDEFKKLGVRKELCKIHVVKGRALKKTQSAFEDLWGDMKKRLGLNTLQAALFIPPDSIGFHNFRPAVWVGNVNDSDFEKALAYAQRLGSVRPVSLDDDPREVGQDIRKMVEAILELVNIQSAEQVRAQADAGDAKSAIDYALRYARVLQRRSLLNSIPESNSASGAPPADSSAEPTLSKRSPAPIHRRLINRRPMAS